MTTGIKLEGEELEQMKAAAERAASAPVVGYGATNLVTLSQMARRDANEKLQAIAIKHGLPDGSFYYSLSLDGEIIVPDGFEAEFDGLRARREIT